MILSMKEIGTQTQSIVQYTLKQNKLVVYYFAPFEEPELRDCLSVHSAAYHLM